MKKIPAGEILAKRNVVGMSKKLKPKIKEGKVTDEMSVRVYVSKKLPKDQILDEDLIPERIEGVKTDVVEIGEVKALPADDSEEDDDSVDPTGRFRPVKFGVSVGNIKITAGTLGWLFEKDGERYFGSNAHVFTPDASMTVEKVMETETRIIQPGSYDKGTADDLIARYVWHERVRPSIDQSDCSLSNAIVAGLNFMSKLLRRKTMFLAAATYHNYIDFAVAKPLEAYEAEIINMPAFSGKFVGLLFAGSNRSTIVCKGRYIAERGYHPYKAEVVEVKDGDVMCKSGRTTKYTEFSVVDDSAVITVSYGDFEAVFDDVIVGGPGSKGGDSGSSVWLKEG